MTGSRTTLDKKYDGIIPISVSRGESHDYLGVVFDYTTLGQVPIHVYQYIDGLIDGTPEICNTDFGSTTLSPSRLYTMNVPEK